MKTLALDLGTNTGWALVDRNGHITSGSEKFAARKTEAPGHRWLKFRAFLAQQQDVNAVYYEDVKMHGLRTQPNTTAAHVYGGFLAHLQTWCAVANITLVPVNVMSVKKHWTGKGNAKKDEMIAAAKAKGFNPVDDNHADALAILSLALQLQKQEDQTWF